MTWEKVRLGDVTDSCLGKMLDQEKNKGEYQPYLANVNVRWGNFDLENLSEMRFLESEEERYGLQYGDLVVCEGGEPGRCAIWKNQVPNMKIQKALHRVRVHDSVDYRYLFYWFLHAGKRGALDQYFTGATIKHMPGDKLKSIVIDLPPLEKQIEIAETLSAYDDLIENNQKQIKLLEEAAQRLYKEWFVDLRFPGYEDTPIVDGVPEGWTRGSLCDLCTLKKDTINAEKMPKDLPYIGLEHLPRKDFCLSEWGYSSSVNSNKLQYAENDILFGKIRPYFHKVGFAINNGVCSTDCIVMKAKRGKWSYLLMTVFSDAFVEYSYQTCKEGSKMPRADWGQMAIYKVVMATDTIHQMFEERVKLITQRIKTLAIENRQLVEARDRLLPKLMNGDIAI